MHASRRKFVHKKLIFRLRLFALLFTGMLSIAIYETCVNYIAIGEAVIALLIGVLIGLLVGISANVFWHEHTNMAIMKMDRLSAVVLVCYLVFAIFRRQVLKHWIIGNELSAFVMSMSSGIALGRLIAIRGKLIKILKQQGK